MKLFIQGGLDKPVNRIRLLILGIVLGGIFYGSGVYVSEVLTPNVAREKNNAAQAQRTYLYNKKPGLVINDPDMMRFYELNEKANKSVESVKFWRAFHFKEVGIGLFIILGLPFFWYFLLNRIKELSSAIKQ